MQALRRLVGRRSARHESGLFVVQGWVLLTEALRAGVGVREVYLREGESDRVGLPVAPFVLDARTFDSVNDTVSPQGVVAVCALPCPAPAKVDPSTWFVVAHGVSDPGNAGTIIRSAEAAGADGVFVTGDSVDVYSPKVVRASAGSIFCVPVRTAVGLGDLRAAGLRLVGTSSHGEAVPVWEADFSGPLAIVLGNEAHGLDRNEPIDEWVTIPHHGRGESLNVAMAATVLALQVARARS